MSRMEILSPAGSAESLVAAVRAGADAVYLGASAFNARQSAANFSDEELVRAVAWCHARGVRVHLTLNTLLREDELPAAIGVARMAAAAGVDALILQDRGLARALRRMMPDMPLHASTQLSCHTPAGVRALRDAGFSRVVLAREMSAAEIAACAGQGCELEIFIHGALCMSVSGQCYLSAMLGGRSGNRGRCAQPCRLPFRPSDGRDTPAGEEFAMSLRDLSLADRFSEIGTLGVCSLKIEGRMKRPEYVAAATAVYAALRDGRPVDEQALARLQAVFSRSGFTDGYFADARGAGMFGHRRHEDVTAADGVLRDLRRLYDREVPRVSVTAAFTSPASLTVSDGDRRVTVTGAPAADGRPPLSPDRVEAQLRKSGGTPFAVEAVSVEGPGDIAVSELNALRREALEKLEQERGKPRHITVSENIPPISEKLPSPLWREDRPRLLVRAATASQLTDEVRTLADGWFLPLGEAARDPHPWGVEIPRGMFGTEGSVRQKLIAAREAGVRYALCGNVGAVPLAREAGPVPVGGFGLNLTNTAALSALAEEGLAAATLSMELTFGQMAFAARSPIPCGALVYGRQPLMLTRNCPRQCGSAPGACGHCRPADGVTDRRGITFPTACAGGCTELLNSVPLWWADRLAELPPLDFWLLHLTVESPAEAAAVLRAYREGGKAPAEITRGLYRRGVE